MNTIIPDYTHQLASCFLYNKEDIVYYMRNNIEHPHSKFGVIKITKTEAEFLNTLWEKLSMPAKLQNIRVIKWHPGYQEYYYKNRQQRKEIQIDFLAART